MPTPTPDQGRPQQIDPRPVVDHYASAVRALNDRSVSRDEVAAMASLAAAGVAAVRFQADSGDLEAARALQAIAAFALGRKA